MPVSDVDLTTDVIPEVSDAVTAEAVLDLSPAEGRAPIARWYAVQVASSCEKKVKATLEQRAVTLGVDNRILEIEIPETPAVKLKKDGSRQSTEEKVFPGYVLVRMVLDEDTMMAVRSTPNVINFVGAEDRRATGKARGHIKPRPLSRQEVDRIFKRAAEKKPVVKVDLTEGDQILVTAGPFKDFQGEVIEVSGERSREIGDARFASLAGALGDPPHRERVVPAGRDLDRRGVDEVVDGLGLSLREVAPGRGVHHARHAGGAGMCGVPSRIGGYSKVAHVVPRTIRVMSASGSVSWSSSIVTIQRQCGEESADGRGGRCTCEMWAFGFTAWAVTSNVPSSMWWHMFVTIWSPNGSASMMFGVSQSVNTSNCRPLVRMPTRTEGRVVK